MAVQQRHWLIEVHDPVVRDAGVGVLVPFDDVVEALRTGWGYLYDNQDVAGPSSPPSLSTRSIAL